MAKFTDETPESEGEDFIFEPVDYTLYISAACEVMRNLADYEPMTKDNQIRKAMILRKCIRMIDHSIGELYNELFAEDPEE